MADAEDPSEDIDGHFANRVAAHRVELPQRRGIGTIVRCRKPRSLRPHWLAEGGAGQPAAADRLQVRQRGAGKVVDACTHSGLVRHLRLVCAVSRKLLVRETPPTSWCCLQGIRGPPGRLRSLVDEARTLARVARHGAPRTSLDSSGGGRLSPAVRALAPRSSDGLHPSPISARSRARTERIAGAPERWGGPFLLASWSRAQTPRLVPRLERHSPIPRTPNSQRMRFGEGDCLGRTCSTPSPSIKSVPSSQPWRTAASRRRAGGLVAPSGGQLNHRQPDGAARRLPV